MKQRADLLRQGRYADEVMGAIAQGAGQIGPKSPSVLVASASC